MAAQQAAKQQEQPNPEPPASPQPEPLPEPEPPANLPEPKASILDDDIPDFSAGLDPAALEAARKAAALGEVPVGAVVARNGEVVAAAHNTRETEKNALHHAELLAIDAACKKLGGWRLWECELFVTLEPCPMCAGAIINSRIRRVVYGAADTKAGCCGSVTDLFAMPFNHHPVVEQGLRAEEAQELLQAFFKDLRARLAARPKWKPPV